MTESLPTPGFFTSALGAYDGNPFENEFRDAEDRKKQLDFNNPGDDNLFFGFSPRGSPFPDERKLQVRPHVFPAHDLDGMDLGIQSNQWNRPRHMFSLDPQSLQPQIQPRTAESPTKEWNVDPSLRQPSSLNKIVTQDMDSTTMVQYGQITPQSDNTPDSERTSGDQAPDETSKNTARGKPGGRRRRSTQVTQHQLTEPANTRQRKSSATAKSMTSDMQDNDDEEVDEKRSKFLERNRVAASKCRMKKKEWTNNLEQRARELQSNKAQLAMMVGALKEEMLYLKGEVLKHNNCNCTAMREYLNREVQSISQQMPFGHGLTGAMSSNFSASPIQDGMDVDQRSPPSAHSSRQGSTSITSPVADHELRALLTTEIQDHH